jgi:hypothetical protein
MVALASVASVSNVTPDYFSRPEPGQAGHEFPGPRDPGEPVLLGLGEHCLDLIPEPAGEAQERGVQGEAGAPAW